MSQNAEDPSEGQWAMRGEGHEGQRRGGGRVCV
jgi:hypothetical protein